VQLLGKPEGHLRGMGTPTRQRGAAGTHVTRCHLDVLVQDVGEGSLDIFPCHAVAVAVSQILTIQVDVGLVGGLITYHSHASSLTWS
jgi:hypothetical protein